MLNKVILIGHLGKDPETRYLANGSAVANFSVATSKKWKDKNDEWQQETQWHRVVAWRKLAETAERLLSKGSLVFIEGEMKYGSYEQNGVTKYTADVEARIIRLLSGRQTDGTYTNQNSDSNDDIPF